MYMIYLTYDIINIRLHMIGINNSCIPYITDSGDNRSMDGNEVDEGLTGDRVGLES